MELYINAFAHYLPDNRVPNSYFKDVNGLDDEWIRTRTGISTRSKAGENENTNTMALEAVKRLHEKLPFPIEEVDLIVAATYSPHDTVATAAHMIQRHFKARAARCLFLVYQRHGNCRRIFRHEQGNKSHRRGL